MVGVRGMDGVMPGRELGERVERTRHWKMETHISHPAPRRALFTVIAVAALYHHCVFGGRRPAAASSGASAWNWWQARLGSAERREALGTLTSDDLGRVAMQPTP